MDLHDVGMLSFWIFLWSTGPIALFSLGYLLLSTGQYIWVLGYILWIFYDNSCETQVGRRSEWLRNLSIWKILRDYYPAKFLVTESLDPSKNYIFGLHPHGVGVQGGINFGTNAGSFSEKFPGIKPHVLVHNMFFIFPLREILICAGFHSVDAKNWNYLLKKKEGGNAVVFVPGGVREMLATYHGNHVQLVLKNRKGFVKQALKHGASLVPVFTFGENDLWNHHPIVPGSVFAKVQAFFRWLMDLPILHVSGRGYTLMPFKKPLHTVVGSPIHCQQSTSPSQEQIDELHRKYVDQLVRIFETNKAQYGYAEQTIEFI